MWYKHCLYCKILSFISASYTHSPNCLYSSILKWWHKHLHIFEHLWTFWYIFKNFKNQTHTDILHTHNTYSNWHVIMYPLLFSASSWFTLIFLPSQILTLFTSKPNQQQSIRGRVVSLCGGIPNLITHNGHLWFSLHLYKGCHVSCAIHKKIQIIKACGDFDAGLAGIRYRTLFQKREFHMAAFFELSGHLMGALHRIRCCKPGGRCEYPSGPGSPNWIRITFISLWTRAWWSPT